MNSLSPNNNKIARNFTIKADQRNDFFHSSGYGATQNSGNIGTASSGLSMAERRALEEKRQFVQKYGNSKLVGSTLNLRHSQSYDPTSANSAPTSANFSATSSSPNVTSSATGAAAKTTAGTPAGVGGSGSATSVGGTNNAVGIGVTNNAIGIGGANNAVGIGSTNNGYSPYRTGGGNTQPTSTRGFGARLNPAAAPRPVSSPARSFTPNIKPTFK